MIKHAKGLQPASREAYDLLHRGSITMSRIEDAGIRIDTSYLDKAIAGLTKTIKEDEQKIRSSPEFKVWSKHYGNNTSLESPAQLGHVIFDALGHPRNPFMKNRAGRFLNNAAAFEHLKIPFKDLYFGLRRKKKALSTYLYGLKREVCNGFLHPFIDLHTTESYRSSSSRINIQNIPVRNKKISAIIRSCIIPRKGHKLLEGDYGQQEVRAAQCYNGDPVLRDYIISGNDMHKDFAMDLFLLSPEELGSTNEDPGKTVRYVAKNGFVFAEFYGSYYVQRAPALWDFISLLGLKTAQGVPMYEHLKTKGITRLGDCDPEKEPRKGTFEYHVKEVERRMWQDRFTVYGQWKKDWVALYNRQGGINTLTGFCMEGYFKRNQILCDPIQGSAFHCLLWSLIRMQDEMLAKKMRSRIILQVHDSVLIDAHPAEVSDLVEMFNRIAVKEVAEHWRWLTVPLQVEYDLCEDNWFNKHRLEMAV